jgi:hypothetical protein
MGVQQKAQTDAGSVHIPQAAITANFLVIASLLSLLVPTVLVFAIVAGITVLLP